MTRAVILLVAVLAAASGTAAAQETGKQRRLPQAVVFLSGVAGGLGIHEAGHLMAGITLGAGPGIKRIDYGGIPFFAIDHHPVTARREFVISSAGLWMQHAGSEWILTRHPDLRHEHSPFLKGVFVFNVATSAMYSVAAFGRIGPPERDTRGVAASIGSGGVPEPVVGLLVAGPAALDVYRYYRPGRAWAAWASRGLKVAAVLLVFSAGR